MKLSILILTIQRDAELFIKLRDELFRQTISFPGCVEILYDDSEFDTIGTKRNRLQQAVTTEYSAFFDADDWPSKEYIRLLLIGISKGVDCCSLKGIYSVNGKFDGYFEHSIKYEKWETVSGPIKYLRTPNHLNCIKSSIAKQFRFRETNWGEDADWSALINHSGLIKTEHYIPEVIYYYKKVTHVQPKQ